MYFPLFVGVLCLSLFCYAILCVHSSFAIILKRERKLVVWLLFCYRCLVTVNVLWLFLMVLWVGLQCVIVVFPDHTHLLFGFNNMSQTVYETKHSIEEGLKKMKCMVMLQYSIFDMHFGIMKTGLVSGISVGIRYF